MGRRRQASLLTVGICFLVTVAHPGSPAGAASSKPTKTTAPAKPITIDPRTLAAAVQARALPIALQAGATLGLPACPSGVTPKAGTFVQCVVGFDAVPVPYLVQLLADAVLVANPTFPVLLQADVESKASLLAKGPVRCGAGRVLVVPPKSEITCQKGKSTLAYRVSEDGSLTAALPASNASPPARTRSK